MDVTWADKEEGEKQFNEFLLKLEKTYKQDLTIVLGLLSQRQALENVLPEWMERRDKGYNFIKKVSNDLMYAYYLLGEEKYSWEQCMEYVVEVHQFMTLQRLHAILHREYEKVKDKHITADYFFNGDE